MRESFFSAGLSASIAAVFATPAISQSIVRDIVPAPANSNPPGSPLAGVTMNGVAYFPAHDEFGRELWRSDGTAAGTYRLKDIQPGPVGSQLQQFVVVGNTVFFIALVSGYQFELWATDGTAAGTRLVRDIAPSYGSTSAAGALLGFQGKLYFRALEPTLGIVLMYESDGTEAGTVPFFGAEQPNNLVAAGNVFYFTATSPSFGNELWQSDGTLAGTTIVADLRPGSGSSAPSNLTVVGNRLFFEASADPVNIGRELYVTDGTSAGTTLVEDIHPGPANSFPTNMVASGGLLIFTATDGTSGQEPWRSDGTAAGTFLLRDILPGSASSSAAEFAAGSSRVMFVASDGSNGFELWSTDGTVAGTTRIDIETGVGGSQPQSITSALGEVVFRATQSTSGVGRELWISDGTAAGTRFIDVLAGSQSASPGDFTPFGNAVLFSASLTGFGGGGTELHISDGTAAGTRLVADIWQAAAAGASMPAHLAAFDGQLFFEATSPADTRDAWLSDGTGVGTTILPLLNGSADADIGSEVLWNGQMWFQGLINGAGRELCRSDGTPSGTVIAVDVNPGFAHGDPNELTPAGSRLFFASWTPNGRELVATDGTPAGTVVLDLHPTGSSTPAYLTAAGNTLFCAANDGSRGFELFASDGSPGGTRRFDIEPGAAGSSPQDLVALGNRVLFSATTSLHGRELFVSDGSLAGTTLLADIVPGAVGSNPSDLVTVGGRVFFTAQTSNLGRELWVSDGSTAGTRLVRDIRPGSANSVFEDMVGAGGRLFFFVNEFVSGLELWVTDGTTAGTTQVTDLMLGAGDSVIPGTLTAMPGTSLVAFAAADPVHGIQLWRSNGTPAGTTRLGTIGTQPGSGAVTIRELTPIGDLLYFACNDGVQGEELWVYSFTTGQNAFAVSYGEACPGTGGLRPQIAARGLPVIGDLGFAVDLSSAAPSSAAVLLISFAPAAVPLLASGCTLLGASPSIALPSVSIDALGNTSTPLPIPLGTTLPNAFGQYLVLDPNGPFLGLLTLSDGLRLQFGS